MTDSEERAPQAALDALCVKLTPVRAVEDVPLVHAARRILARDLVAPCDLPAFPNAAMDGYAVRAADCGVSSSLRIVGAAYAGHGFSGALDVGTAVRITTGAPLPEGADAVVMQEDVQRDGDVIRFSTEVAPGLHVRPRGQHVRTNDVLMSTGQVMHAAGIGLATLVGATSLPVFRRLLVGIASTGDELADPPAQTGPSGSYDGNRAMIAATCRNVGFDVHDFGICADRAVAFNELLEHAAQGGVDALLVIGGSALGDADVVRQASEVAFIPLSIRPGRGVTFALFPPQGPQRIPLLGLPGNAVAAFVMFQFFALPALVHLAGGVSRTPVHFPVPLAEDVLCDPGRIDYRRGRLERTPTGEITVRPLRQQGAGMLRTLVDADVLIAAGPERLYRRGSLVSVVPLAALPR